jgi:hypothetical protein
MAAVANIRPQIRVSYDEMEAYMTLPVPADNEVYSIDFLNDSLAEKGVTTGVDQVKLLQMATQKLYGEEYLVAEGLKPREGKDGFYEYHFNSKIDNKPKVMPDGSVDYWSVNSIEQVQQGQVIAIYHPAIPGEDGVNVKGKSVAGKRSRDLLPLKGKGFTRSEDGLLYTSDVDGKIEMANDRILIQNIYEVRGDADLGTGNIDFRGDVIIHGAVEAGVTIKATGTITVDGVVETCVLEAGKDIVLRSGMMGGNKALVRTKGNIIAKFFEFTTIECDGDIQADVLMDCEVHCKGEIIMTGARGSIIGGEVHAIRGIQVMTLGNDVEKKTSVYVGAGLEVYSNMRILEKKCQEGRENLEKVEKGLHQFEVLEQKRGVSYKDDPRRMSLLRVKIRDAATLASDEAELGRLKALAERAEGACVSVLGTVYPGVAVHIDEMRFTLKNAGRCVEFYKLPDKISTRTCYMGVD